MKKQLERIYKNAQNLLSLVNQLLDFRKLEMKGEKLSLMSGDMGKFIVAIYDNFMPIAVEKHLNFDYRSMHKSLYVFFDCDKVRKIVNNLLSNAFKFTPEGGSVALSVSTEETEGRMYVKIDVSDTGVGISKSDLPFIFDRFYQTGKQTDEKPGSGIGLHLVREYAAIHEGRIKVKSQTDCGTTFMVWLPMDLKPDMKMATEKAVEKTNSVSETVESLTAAGEGRHKKLLLIEDNKEFRTFLKSNWKISTKFLRPVMEKKEKSMQ